MLLDILILSPIAVALYFVWRSARKDVKRYETTDEWKARNTW